MSKTEASNYLPEQPNAINVFDKVGLWHCDAGNNIEELLRLPDEKRLQVGTDYFVASLAFFANPGQNHYLREVAITSSRILNKGSIKAILTDDARGYCIEAGINNTDGMNLKEKQFNVVFLQETGIVLIPSEFVLLAKEDPIDALASVLYVFSQIRDFANGRLHIDPSLMAERAEATQAHFLKEAVKLYPEIKSDPDYNRLLSKYPKGIDNLPKEALYKGSTDE